MDDRDSVIGAYADTVRQLATVFIDAQMTGNDATKQQAEANFKKGLAAARVARDKALGLLGAPA